MIKYIEGDLFGSPAQVIVNTVNTVGVMGKGIALEYKKRYPGMFDYYKKACEKHKLIIGKMLLWYAPDHWVLLFPTKEHWKNPSKLEYIEKGLKVFVKKYAEYNISSIAFPRLGCGNGELNWDDVRRLMEEYLMDLPIEIFVYQGTGNVEKPICDKRDALDLSFEGMKDEICFRTMMMPAEVLYDGTKWNAAWPAKKGLRFEKGHELIQINEMDVREMWDYVCEKRVLPTTDDRRKGLFYSLINSMGYLQEISFSDDNSGEMISGYQLEMGKARKFWLRVNDE